MLILSIFGATVIVAVLLGYLAYLYGKNKEQKEIAQNNLEAVKSGKETKKAISKLSEDELNALLDKRLRKKGK